MFESIVDSVLALISAWEPKSILNCCEAWDGIMDMVNFRKVMLSEILDKSLEKMLLRLLERIILIKLVESLHQLKCHILIIEIQNNAWSFLIKFP